MGGCFPWDQIEEESGTGSQEAMQVNFNIQSDHCQQARFYTSCFNRAGL